MALVKIMGITRKINQQIFITSSGLNSLLPVCINKVNLSIVFFISLPKIVSFSKLEFTK